MNGHELLELATSRLAMDVAKTTVVLAATALALLLTRKRSAHLRRRSRR